MALREQQITLVSVVATTLTRLLDAGLEHPPALRCALTGGGPVPPALVSRAREAGVPVSLTYGLTEACSQVTTAPVAGSTGKRPSAGPPLFCTRVRIGDASQASNQQLPAGEEGEISIAGPTVAPGSLDDDGWLHTGDFGVLDEHGRLHVPGVRPTRSSAVARTSRRPRSRRCWRHIPTCSRRRFSAVPMNVGARPSRRSWWRARGPRWSRRHCAPIALSASLRIRCPSRCRLPTSHCHALARESSCARSFHPVGAEERSDEL